MCECSYAGGCVRDGLLAEVEVVQGPGGQGRGARGHRHHRGRGQHLIRRGILAQGVNIWKLY